MSTGEDAAKAYGTAAGIAGTAAGVAAAAAPAAAAAAAFGISTAIGTAIPIPVLGTAIGAVVGAFAAAGVAIASVTKDTFHPTPTQAGAWLKLFQIDPALIFQGVDKAENPEDGARLVRYFRLVSGLVPNLQGSLYNPVSNRSCENPYMCAVDPAEPLTDPKVLEPIYQHAKRAWSQGKGRSFDHYVLPEVKTPAAAAAVLGMVREHFAEFLDVAGWSEIQNNAQQVRDEIKRARLLAGEDGPDPVLAKLFGGDVTVHQPPPPPPPPVAAPNPEPAAAASPDAPAPTVPRVRPSHRGAVLGVVGGLGVAALLAAAAGSRR